MEEENYGAKIKELRIQNNLTQNQVAESLGITPGYISNVENNRTAMSLRILMYYARLMGCSLDSLVGELESEYSETSLDRELHQAIIKLDTKTKEKLLKPLSYERNKLSEIENCGNPLKDLPQFSAYN